MAIEKNKIWYLLPIIMSAMFISLLSPSTHEVFSKFATLYILFFSIIVAIVLFTYQFKVEKRNISFNSFFVVGYFITNFELAAHLLDSSLIPFNYQFYYPTTLTINYSLWLSAMAFTLYVLSYILFKKQNKALRLNNINTINVMLIKIRFTVLLLIIANIIFYLSVGKSFWSGVYDESKWGSVALYLDQINRTLVILFMYFSFKYKNSTNKVPKDSLFICGVIASALYLFLMVRTGDRGLFISLFSVSLFLYCRFIRRVNLKQLIFLGITAIVLMSIIGLGRAESVRGNSNGLVASGYESFIKNEERLTPTMELASSNKLLFVAVDKYDSSNYYFGLTMVGQVISSIPLLGGFTSLITGFSFPTSTNEFTYLMQGSRPNYGEGSHLIADLYINFGTVGVLIFMVLFGYLVATLYNSINKETRFIILVILISYGVYLNRSSLLFVLKPVVLILIIYYIINLYTKQRVCHA
ncbi:O-antigen polymerase [Bacteroides propionicifaciens]|uniref:O-antigen polymerase n=1 Tax=Bacteroides propionicifaciens TaxID=392838 RepID=UPI00138AEE2D|nr:O-antigen polymerase [Bacteroides propionicifaciens]